MQELICYLHCGSTRVEVVEKSCVVLFVVSWLLNVPATRVYLRGGSAQTILRATTLR